MGMAEAAPVRPMMRAAAVVSFAKVMMLSPPMARLF
jgi:hypothetical protein